MAACCLESGEGGTGTDTERMIDRATNEHLFVWDRSCSLRCPTMRCDVLYALYLLGEWDRLASPTQVCALCILVLQLNPLQCSTVQIK